MSGVGFPIVTKAKDSSCCPIPVSKSRHSFGSINEAPFQNDGDNDESPYKDMVPHRTKSIQEQQRYSISTPTGDFLTAIGTDYDHVFEATITLYYYYIISFTTTPFHDKASSSLGDEGQQLTHSVSVTATTTTFVEMHLRCSVLGRAFSSHNQQFATCRIPISAFNETFEYCDSNFDPTELISRKYTYTWSDVIPSVVFSSGGTYISCLVPHPIRIQANDSTQPLYTNLEKATTCTFPTPSLSSIVIFSVHKAISGGPRAPSPCHGLSKTNIPLPTYVTQSLPKTVSTFTTMEDQSEVPSLSSPRVVRIGSSPSDTLDYAASKIHQVTCICNMTTPTLSSTNNNKGTNSETHKNFKSSILLAGCTDGSILAIGYKKARLLHIWLQPSMLKRDHDDDYTLNSNTHDLLYDSLTPTTNHLEADSSKTSVSWNNSDHGIIFMTHNQYIHPEFETIVSESKNRGKLVIIRRDGIAICFSTWYHRTRSSIILQQEEQQQKDNISLRDNNVSLHQSIQIQDWDLDGAIGDNDDDPCLVSNIQSSEFILHKRRGIVLRISPLPFTFYRLKKETSSFRLYYRCTFVVDDLIAFLIRPVQPNDDSLRKRDSIIAEIWYLRDQSSTSRLLSELSMTEQELREAHHDTFLSFLNFSHVNEAKGDGIYKAAASIYFSGIQIACDSRTKCIVIDSAIQAGTAQISSRNMLRFSSIWDFKSNAYGFTLLCDQPILVHERIDDSTFGYGYSILSFSQLNFLQHGPLVHIYSQGRKIRKVRYDYSIAMSTDSRSSFPIVRLDIASPLMTSSGSISFPECNMPLYSRDFSVKWSEVTVPNYVISNCGSIKLSTIGRSKGRSIAVACDHGFSVLEIPNQSYIARRGKAISHADENSLIKTVSRDYGIGPNAHEALVQRNNRMKWRCFGNSQEERAISVICMTWWERQSLEDLLIAVVEYDSNQQANNNPFLACWSSKRIGYEHQLMTSDGMFALGVPLPSDISPMMITLLSTPVTDSSSSNVDVNRDDRAVILISELKDEGLIFSIFQIQSAYTSKNGKSWSTNRLFVLAKLHLQGTIKFNSRSSPSSSEIGGKFYSIFIAGSSFCFNLFSSESKHMNGNNDQSDAFVTIGLLMDFGERLYALKLVPSQREHLPFLVHKSIHVDTNNFITRIWMAGSFESIGSRLLNTAWTFVMNSGESFSWFVPSMSTTSSKKENWAGKNTLDFSEDLLFGRVTYERNCLKLRSCDGGCLLLAPLPCSTFRYILSIQQQSRLVKSIPKFSSPDSRQKIFHIGDFILGPPTFISIIYHLATDRCMSLNNINTIPLPTLNPLDSLCKSLKCYDSFRVALGTIVPFIIDMVYTSYQSDRHELRLSKMLLSQIVSGTRLALMPLEFVSVYINIGRLLEPHHFDCLFPLPSEDMHSNVSATQVSSLDAMISLSTMCGSAKILSSSLTINPRKYSSHKLCNQLFHHHMTKILNSTRLDGDMQANIVLEDLPYVMQLYRYSLKLEDSNNLDLHNIDYYTAHSNGREKGEMHLSIHDNYRSSSFTGRKSTRRSLRNTNGIEIAIANAASNFILSGIRYPTDENIPIAFVGSDFTHVMLSKLLIAEIVFTNPTVNSINQNLNQSWKLLALISMLLENETSDIQMEKNFVSNLFSNISSEELILGLRIGSSDTNTYPNTISGVIRFVHDLFHRTSSYLSTREILSLNKLTTVILMNGPKANHIDAVMPPLIFLFLATFHANEGLRDRMHIFENDIIADIVSSLGKFQS